MALSKDIEVRKGLIASNAYIKIESILGTKEKLTIKAHHYASLESKIAGEPSITFREYSFVPDLNGNNFIAQGYAHLKTLDEYKDAVDC